MNIYVCLTHGNTPIPHSPTMGTASRITEADVIVLMHMNGTWSVWRDRTVERPEPARRVPWDLLPSHVKRAIPLYRHSA